MITGLLDTPDNWPRCQDKQIWKSVNKLKIKVVFSKKVGFDALIWKKQRKLDKHQNKVYNVDFTGIYLVYTQRETP